MKHDQLCATTLLYHPFPLERALSGIANVGITRVELAALVGFCDHAAPERLGFRASTVLSRLLRDHDLTAVSLSGHADLSWEYGVRAMADRLKLASDMGIAIVSTTSTGEPGPQAESRFYMNIAPLAELAGKLGVVIAIESGGPLTATGQACARAVEKIDHPNVRINYDTANPIFQCGVRPEGDIAAAMPYMVHMHIKDKASMELERWDFSPIGSGIIDWDVIMGELDRAGFSGPASIESYLDGHPETPEIADDALHQSFKFLSRYLH